MDYRNKIALELLYENKISEFKNLFRGYSDLNYIDMLAELEQLGYIIAKDPIIFTNKTRLALSAETAPVKILQTRSPTDAFIKTYRLLFAGKRPRSMGSYKNVVENMTLFINKFDYTEEIILKAAKRHLEEHSDKNYKYINNADTFIFNKKGSPLKDYCTIITLNKEEKRWQPPRPNLKMTFG